MFASVQTRRTNSRDSNIDIAPLIDMVFILLIFFLVTTSFVQDTGIEVERPQAVYSQPLTASSFRISITRNGLIYAEGRRRELAELRLLVSTFIRREENSSVIVIPDAQTNADRLIEVMDIAKLAGAERLSVATRREGP